MTPYWVRPGLAAFALLSGGLAANLLYFQQGTRTVAVVGGEGPIPAWSLQLTTGSTGPARPEAREGGGDRAELTRAIQRELRAKGYEAGTVDGVAGLVTRAAIMAYEADRGFSLTGEPDEALLERLVLGAEGKAPPAGAAPGATGPEAERVIRAVQRGLASIGLRPGAIDGRLSAETVKAIRAFEVAQKLPESGRISGSLVARLARVAGQGTLTETR